MAGMFGFMVVALMIFLDNGYVNSSEISDLIALAEQQNNDIKVLKSNIEEIGRQILLQQQYVEERIRSDGSSGLKQLRASHKGTRNYYSETFGFNQVAAIHDHSNYDRTCGMGEINIVMNGVEFRTRHNDYKLSMPSKTKTGYHETDEIPFPPVPPSVTSKRSVPDQIQEMREYFKAFKEQDTRHRDYTPYFKPILCYVEGAWTTDTKSITEPFKSDRHFLDASSWFDLQHKVRYTSYTGSKSNFENFSYLPTSIINVHNGSALLAQWNYRIMCNPIKTPFSRLDLQKVNDVAQKFAQNKMEEQLAFTRIPRFTFVTNHNSVPKRHFNATLGYASQNGQYYTPGILDKIMQEIPGTDNYPAKLNDSSFGYKIKNIFNDNLLNTGYYHRWYKVERDGISGTKTALRGFADPNLFVAQTTSPRVAPVSVTDCPMDQVTQKRVCHTYTTRYTYAIPLEIIWLSPLYLWNPYNFRYYNTSFYQPPANAVTKDDRNGGLTKDKAYNGTNNNYFYFTPAEFFHGKEVSRDPADTAKDVVGVLDPQGNVRQVVASGTKIILPEIPGVGKLRMRYQVMPVHAEGNPSWKELNALKEMMLDVPRFYSYFENAPHGTPKTPHYDVHLLTSEGFNGTQGIHKHEVYLTQEEMNALSNNHTINTVTTVANGHYHSIVVQYLGNVLSMAKCDGFDHCPDGHTATLHRVPMFEQTY